MPPNLYKRFLSIIALFANEDDTGNPTNASIAAKEGLVKNRIG